MTYYVGRLIDHVHINVANLQRAARFYQAVLSALGHPPGSLGPQSFSADEFYVSEPGPGQRLSHVHLAFQAPDPATVDRFHAAALAAGGTDNGGPGERVYHPGYYAAFVLDPDSNNIEAVWHGASTRSADAIAIEPVS